MFFLYILSDGTHINTNVLCVKYFFTWQGHPNDSIDIPLYELQLTLLKYHYISG